MNDTVVTEHQEQPATRNERKARELDRGSGRRTSLGPAENSSAPIGRTYDRSRPNRSNRKKCLPSGRPHMSLMSLATISRVHSANTNFNCNGFFWVTVL